MLTDAWVDRLVNVTEYSGISTTARMTSTETLLAAWVCGFGRSCQTGRSPAPSALEITPPTSPPPFPDALSFSVQAVLSEQVRHLVGGDDQDQRRHAEEQARGSAVAVVRLLDAE